MEDSLPNPFSDYTVLREDDSREVYYLLKDQDLNLKLRYGILDLKKRLRVTQDGLEQWSPVFKASLPLDLIHQQSLQEFLGKTILLKGEDIEADFYRNADVRVVNVHKLRMRYEISGVITEFTRLKIDDQRLNTLALEHLEPERIQSCRKKFGLLSHMNESYPQALRRLKKME